MANEVSTLDVEEMLAKLLLYPDAMRVMIDCCEHGYGEYDEVNFRVDEATDGTKVLVIEKGCH